MKNHANDQLSSPENREKIRPAEHVQAEAFTRHDTHAIPNLPWMQLGVGSRVVVRYRLDDGLHDALGTLIEAAPTRVVIETRRGQVRVDARTMVTGKRVPPPPQI